MTDKQRQVLQFFVWFTMCNGVGPTVREVADHFGWAPNGAWGHIKALMRDGHLRQVKQSPRCILPVE